MRGPSSCPRARWACAAGHAYQPVPHRRGPEPGRRFDADGAATDAGIAAREQLEVETDEHCAALWTATGDTDARRLASLILPIHDAFTGARTYPFPVEVADARPDGPETAG
ncbi:hypothetical protein GCM10028784_08060 [Myceligenerans cantabricum]